MAVKTTRQGEQEPSEEVGSVAHTLLAVSQSASNGHRAHLLGLPVELISGIIALVTNKSDLAALALCHSTLHAVVIPYLYSTLAMENHGREMTKEKATSVSISVISSVLSSLTAPSHSDPIAQQSAPNSGVHNAQYVKTLSLIDSETFYREGPAREYFGDSFDGPVGKDIAAVIQHMNNLETFIWSLPIALPKSVWSSLASLGVRYDQCRLQRIWIRWPDNRPLSARIEHHKIGPGDKLLKDGTTLSDLPPLASISVINISELWQLDEMSELIERSLDKLRELRVGMYWYSNLTPWYSNWNKSEGQQVCQQSPRDSTLTLNTQRLGGPLGVLTGCFFDLRLGKLLPRRQRRPTTVHNDTTAIEGKNAPAQGLSTFTDASSLFEAQSEGTPSIIDVRSQTAKLEATSVLHLDVLELFRVPLHITVLSATIDWPRLTSLTILDCPGSAELWNMLRDMCMNNRPESEASHSAYNESKTSQSGLNLKVIHTNCGKQAFIRFVAHGLDPDTLEAVILHECWEHRGEKVALVHVYEEIVQRHGLSLRRLLVTSRTLQGKEAMIHDWVDWGFDRRIIGFISNGNLPLLQELAFDMNYRDWVYFLKCLPSMPQIQSLMITLVKYARSLINAIQTGDGLSIAAAQDVLKVVKVHAEMQLRYIGINDKCFEIQRDGQPQNGPVGTASNANSSTRSHFIVKEVPFYDKVSIFKARDGGLCP